MDYQIRNTENTVELNQLIEVENKYGFRFPNEYKEFLLKYNGGQITPRNFVFGTKDYEGSRIDRFLAIHDGPYDNFESYFKIYKIDAPRLPEHLIPIAHDDGGSLICIATTGHSIGSMYFWDHEEELYGDNVFLIESGFNKFLNSLS